MPPNSAPFAFDLCARGAVRRFRRPAAWAIVLGLAVLVIALTGEWAASRAARNQADEIRRAAEVQLSGLRDATGRYRHLPFAAALHPVVLALLRSPKDVALGRSTNLYLEELNRLAGSDVLYLIDRQGVTLAASNWVAPHSFVGHSYANRPYFTEALAGRSGRFYGVGQTTGEPGLFISAPVRGGDGGVLGVVTVKVSLRQLQESWRIAKDPILLTDARGIVFLSSVPQWLYHATRPVDPPALAQVRRDQQYGPLARFPQLPWKVTPDGDRPGALIRTQIDGQARYFLAVSEPVEDLPWTLTVMADHDQVLRTRESAWMVALLCLSLLLLAGLYWRLRERRFAEQRDARRELELRVEERTHALGEAHAFRKAMEDALPVGMRARDMEGRITYVNPAFCQMTGFEAGELLGRLPPYPYWHPDEVTRHWHHYEAMMSGQPSQSGHESRLRHKDGHEVITMVYTAPLIDAEGRHAGWMSSVVDVTEQRRAELQQRQNEAQLQHAQRMASLGEMASTLAHELNQPLMALSSFASAAKAFAQRGEGALLAQSLDDTIAQAQRSAEIVRRIRGFVRQRTAGAEDCAVATLVAQALALLRGELREGQVVPEVRIPGDLPLLRGDRVLLEQVLLNLVSNSLHAMRGVPPAERRLEIDAERREGGIQLRVADRGTGIDPAIADQVFAPFFTTRAGGLGLGLNICRTIVEAHRGRLTFAGREGGGTVFTLELPIAPP
ncbi:PAS domain S-box-containing protein [Pseudacidovorax intermedius]|uniref:histidine kinase n=1 Tax=Pseudacidovorax intermedius TaxID=433924 RepID=A0A370FCS8_9BURK|nr:PAS domain S-box-containing protein [Pseudacidovorax intermedius]